MLWKTDTDPAYFNHERPEILNAIPRKASRILDLGCGAGILGTALKKRGPCTIHGIELNLAAHQKAGQVYDICIKGNLDILSTDQIPGSYDVIVAADVLEHLMDPWGVIKKYTDLLTEDGLFILSVPNMAHPSVIHDLQRDLFRYTPAGLLDITHLRFFTLPTITQLLTKAGLSVSQITRSPAKGPAIQYIITAQKVKTEFTEPICTIIMPVRNALHYTRRAIQSIRAHTQCPHKIIIVDNASNNETSAWIDDQADLLTVRTKAEIGFPTACNLGLACVDTKYTMLINSDVEVTPSWLCDMLSTMEADGKIGILGPMTNYASGPQRDPNAHYSLQRGFHAYAENLKKQKGPRLQTCDRIVFFCALIRSELFGKIGFLDESFGLGNFEDDDFCIRSIRAKYKNVIDRHVFVHHYGSQTFKESRIDYRKLMETSEKRFRSKWGLR